MLAGRDFVVLRLGEYAEFPELFIQLLHIVYDALFDRAEIVIFQFLTLGRARAEQRSSRKYEIRAFCKIREIYQKVLLFGADGRNDLLHVVFAKQL